MKDKNKNTISEIKIKTNQQKQNTKDGKILKKLKKKDKKIKLILFLNLLLPY